MSHTQWSFALALACSMSACGSDQTGGIGDDLTIGTKDFKRSPSLNVANISKANSSKSHNVGENCVSCHQEYGPGRGLFTVAGTILDDSGVPLENPIVELYSGPADDRGQLILRVEGDKLGNFYTTEELPLPEQPLFVQVASSDGQLNNFMPFPVSNGSCNHCHSGGFAIRLHPDMGVGGARVF